MIAPKRLNPHFEVYPPGWTRFALRLARPVLEAIVLGACGWLVILLAVLRVSR